MNTHPFLISLFALVAACAHADRPAQILVNGKPLRASRAHVGLTLFTDGIGPQAVVASRSGSLFAAVDNDESVEIVVPLGSLTGKLAISTQVHWSTPSRADLALSINQFPPATLDPNQDRLRVAAGVSGNVVIRLRVTAKGRPAAVWCRNLSIQLDGRPIELPVVLPASPADDSFAPLPNLRQPIEQFLIQWDWRMQDGIDTPREPRTYAQAIQSTLERGDHLLQDWKPRAPIPADLLTRWNDLKIQFASSSKEPADSPQWEDLWRRVHELRRALALSHPLAPRQPIAFIKQVPSIFSHQLTQYYGSCARPGGGVFVLDQPGRSMQARQIAGSTLPPGSFQHLDISPDGQRLLFAYCQAPTTPKSREQHLDRFYHLYEIDSDGQDLRQLTRGSFDDFSPRYLPDGKILMISTRRGGYHRCGRGPCPTYTLCLMDAPGSQPRPISFHETHEWDPCVLNDGRIIYTRWDYVDRNAVHYQQLWAARPDGSNVQIFYGNNTLNPVGVWEARPIPKSTRIIATAAAHHAMTAGSIIRIDPARGVDDLDPITRLTPDALFPESEAPVLREAGKSGAWHAPVGVVKRPDVPPEALRWPGHCYRSPFPLGENHFLAAYSFDALIGEPNANLPNLFGLYLVDAFGNKELLYRDLNIASLWPMPLAAQPAGPTIRNTGDSTRDGAFFMHNVHKAWPALPHDVPIKRLRIIQVLPKTTPHINDPIVGLASASPGKQVLGTVPVEPDGSAYFRAPAGIPLSFQALDERGQAVQTMRSITYLQPGETATCVGCHEPRHATPAATGQPMALRRAPSSITPGPDGSNPLSYPLLVQPVLDAKCVSCHNPQKPEGKVVLTGQVEGRFTRSYNAMVKHVPFAAWGNGLSMKANSEPLTAPDHFGARASKLMRALLKGHYDVKLTDEELQRLITWMDANALFYGTFDPADQRKQQAGERIEGPRLQ